MVIATLSILLLILFILGLLESYNHTYYLNKIPNRIQAPSERLSVAAVHPPIGGIAPGIEPINVVKVENRINGVYENSLDKNDKANDKI